MTIDERSLLLLLAKIVLSRTRGSSDNELRAAIAHIEAAEDRAADEEKINGRG